MDRFIKLPEKMIYDGIFEDTDAFRVFLYLILKSGNSGEVKTTIKEISDSVKISTQKVRTILNNKQNNKQITIKTTNKFTSISIVNYRYYKLSENNEQQTGQQTNNNQNNKQAENPYDPHACVNNNLNNTSLNIVNTKLIQDNNIYNIYNIYNNNIYNNNILAR